LSRPIASWHISQMLFSAREHLASHWLDLAEGRLRLDRLNRNGGGETFFPWAKAHSSRNKKVSPPPSSAALRPERVRRRIAFGFQIAIEAAVVAELETS